MMPTMILKEGEIAPPNIAVMQCAATEIGRLRLGYSDNGPKKSETFIFSGQHVGPLEDAAALYGGEVKTWDNRPKQVTDTHRLFSTSKEIDATITSIPEEREYNLWDPQTRHYARKCNGVTCMLRQPDGRSKAVPCMCPQDVITWKEEKKKGAKHCNFMLRLNVIIPNVGGLGVWRVQTAGYFAGTEIPETTRILRLLAQNGTFVKVKLAISQRSGEFKYPVLEVRVEQTLQDLLGKANSLGYSAIPRFLTAEGFQEAPRQLTGQHFGQQSLPPPSETNFVAERYEQRALAAPAETAKTNGATLEPTPPAQNQAAGPDLEMTAQAVCVECKKELDKAEMPHQEKWGGRCHKCYQKAVKAGKATVTKPAPATMTEEVSVDDIRALLSQAFHTEALGLVWCHDVMGVNAPDLIPAARRVEAAGLLRAKIGR